MDLSGLKPDHEEESKEISTREGEHTAAVDNEMTLDNNSHSSKSKKNKKKAAKKQA
jgi:hypothetical protein